MKKRILALLIGILLLTTLCWSPAFADTLDDITFNSGTMFSVGIGNGQNFTYVVRGLVGGSKVTISDPANIHWTSSNPSLVSLSSGTGATVTISSASSGSGSVVITATYGSLSVHSDVLVANGYVYDKVTNITVTVKFNPNNSADAFTKTLSEVNNFSLKDVFGSGFNDSGVKKDKVTALHALLFALEEKYDPQGVSDGWDWVSANVVLTYNGAYVFTIRGCTNWWTYYIQTSPPNGAWSFPSVAASQYVMNNGYAEEWRFVQGW